MLAFRQERNQGTVTVSSDFILGISCILLQPFASEGRQPQGWRAVSGFLRAPPDFFTRRCLCNNPTKTKILGLPSQSPASSICVHQRFILLPPATATIVNPSLLIRSDPTSIPPAHPPSHAPKTLVLFQIIRRLPYWILSTHRRCRATIRADERVVQQTGSFFSRILPARKRPPWGAGSRRRVDLPRRSQ